MDELPEDPPVLRDLESVEELPDQVGPGLAHLAQLRREVLLVFPTEPDADPADVLVATPDSSLTFDGGPALSVFLELGLQVPHALDDLDRIGRRVLRSRRSAEQQPWEHRRAGRRARAGSDGRR